MIYQLKLNFGIWRILAEHYATGTLTMIPKREPASQVLATELDNEKVLVSHAAYLNILFCFRLKTCNPQKLHVFTQE